MTGAGCLEYWLGNVSLKPFWDFFVNAVVLAAVEWMKNLKTKPKTPRSDSFFYFSTGTLFLSKLLVCVLCALFTLVELSLKNSWA